MSDLGAGSGLHGGWDQESMQSYLTGTPGVSFPGARPAEQAEEEPVTQVIPQPGYVQQDAALAGSGQAGYDQAGYEQTGDGQGAYGEPAYGQVGYDQAGYDQAGYDQAWYGEGGGGQTATLALSTPSIATLPQAGREVAEEGVRRSAGVAEFLRARDPEVDEEFVRSIEAVLDLNASDLHMSGESRPEVRVDGGLRPVEGTSVWEPGRVAAVVRSIISDEQAAAFEHDLELDLAFAVGDIARFRVNVFRDRTGVGAVMRLIPTKIKTLAELGVPENLAELGYLPRGLVLVCGPTGSGKSTTLAAIIDVVNANRACHIVTVEDPIEFLHHHKKALINQREVGADTHSFAEALKHALRQDPDVILVGELRDLETISTALTAAETGHLVFATLHTQDAAQTIDRIIDVYPPHQQAQVRTQLAATIKAVVVQTLLPRASGTGRVVATEVMLTNAAIANLVRSGKTHQIRTVLQSSESGGMHTLDQDLARLVNAGVVEETVAAEQAQDLTEYEQMISSGGLRGNLGRLPMEGDR